MASLNELIMAADNLRANRRASNGLQSFVDNLGVGLNTGYDQGMDNMLKTQSIIDSNARNRLAAENSRLAALYNLAGNQGALTTAQKKTQDSATMKGFRPMPSIERGMNEPVSNVMQQELALRSEGMEPVELAGKTMFAPDPHKVSDTYERRVDVMEKNNQLKREKEKRLDRERQGYVKPAGQLTENEKAQAEFFNLKPDMNGNIKFPSESRKKRMTAQKYFKEGETGSLRKHALAATTLKQVVDTARGLGLTPEQLGNGLRVSSESIKTAIGPLSVPARVRLIGELKNPKYAALKALLERAFQEYRIAVTGAQASVQELRILRDTYPMFVSTPAAFYETADIILKSTEQGIDKELGMYEAMGRDVSQMRDELAKIYTTNADLNTVAVGGTLGQGGARNSGTLSNGVSFTILPGGD